MELGVEKLWQNWDGSKRKLGWVGSETGAGRIGLNWLRIHRSAMNGQSGVTDNGHEARKRRESEEGSIARLNRCCEHRTSLCGDTSTTKWVVLVMLTIQFPGCAQRDAHFAALQIFGCFFGGLRTLVTTSRAQTGSALLRLTSRQEEHGNNNRKAGQTNKNQQHQHLSLVLVRPPLPDSSAM